jgi:hypothetical protein
MLRFMLEQLGNGQIERRGQLQQVSSGDEHYYRDSHMMLSYLVEMLPPAQTGGKPPA